MSFGFVYILVNGSMPDTYKVGCTERSPHQRADELSKPTGVPTPFRVFCYAEFPDCQSVEQALHKWLSECRVSPQREFFEGRFADAVSYLKFHPKALAFCVPSTQPRLEGFHAGYDINCPADDMDLNDLVDVWDQGFDETSDSQKAADITDEVLSEIAGRAGL